MLLHYFSNGVQDFFLSLLLSVSLLTSDCYPSISKASISNFFLMDYIALFVVSYTRQQTPNDVGVCGLIVLVHFLYKNM